jgi:hypothetical protein
MIALAILVLFNSAACWFEIGGEKFGETRGGQASSDSKIFLSSRSKSDGLTHVVSFPGLDASEQEPLPPQLRNAIKQRSDPLIETALHFESRLNARVRRFRETTSIQVGGTPVGCSVVAFELRGSYDGLKRWTALMLSSGAQMLAIKSFELTRTGDDAVSEQDVEAHVEFLFNPNGASP